jgi:hypothetical protein
MYRLVVLLLIWSLFFYSHSKEFNDSSKIVSPRNISGKNIKSLNIVKLFDGNPNVEILEQSINGIKVQEITNEFETSEKTLANYYLNYGFQTIEYINGTYYAGGGAGLIKSDDGNNWNRVDVLFDEINSKYISTEFQVRAIGHFKNKILIIPRIIFQNRLGDIKEYPFSIIESENTTDFLIKQISDITVKTSGLSAKKGLGLWDIATNEEVAVVVGADASIFYTNDGKNWYSAEIINGRKRNKNIPNCLYSICWTGEKFVAVGDNGKAAYSNDGKKWTFIDTPSDNILHSVSYGNNTTIALGDYGTALYSSDGKVWHRGFINYADKFASDENYINLVSSIYKNDRFVALGYKTTGLNTIQRFQYKFHALGWGKIYFPIYGILSESMIMLSKDGITWNELPHTRNIQKSFQHITWDGTQFIAVAGAVYGVPRLNKDIVLTKYRQEIDDNGMKAYILGTDTQTIERPIFDSLPNLFHSADGINWEH